MASQGPSDFGQPGPGDESAPYHSGNAYESGGDSNSSKSPLHIGLGFLKGLTEKKTTRDGQPAKRRGPKPDSKPALTRRQELNRQAQRTHRERKELYIKALEQEVLRLKESYAHLNRERDTVIEENIKLKELLRQHGITSFPSGLPLSETQVSGGNTEFGGSSCGSMSETYGGTISSGYSPATGPQTYAAPTNATFSSGQDTVRPEDRARSLSQQQQLPPPHPHPHAARPPQQQGQPQGQQPRLDYDQTGIDFVLTYDYTPYLSPPPQQ
ncbi:MAG: hypothetical protein M1833_004314 [Piccolia ochrophora]|nr:MAG: hypothetical protein M1833_004314 [Piccolia ochrophora]